MSEQSFISKYKIVCAGVMVPACRRRGICLPELQPQPYAVRQHGRLLHFC